MALRQQLSAEVLNPATPLPERSIPVEDIGIGEIPDLSFIPTDVSNFLALEGRCLSLGSSNPSYIASRSIHSSHPLNVELDIAENRRKEFRAVCIKWGLRVTPDGNISRGDCLIYAQDKAARDRELRLTELRMLARRHGANDANSLRDQIPAEFANDRQAVTVEAFMSLSGG